MSAAFLFASLRISSAKSFVYCNTYSEEKAAPCLTALNDVNFKRSAIGLNQLFTFSCMNIKCLGEFMERVYHVPVRFGLCSVCHIREKSIPSSISFLCGFALEKKNRF